MTWRLLLIISAMGTLIASYQTSAVEHKVIAFAPLKTLSEPQQPDVSHNGWILFSPLANPGSMAINMPTITAPPKPVMTSEIVKPSPKKTDSVAIAQPVNKTFSKRILDLKLPKLNNVPSIFKTQSRVRNLFIKTEREEITYKAELVYDADKGEDITGGKVNIEIPFG